ncbi:hypothetical protein C2H96_19360 [Bacillus subtilis]|uniref:hypothetical protein n=1 Tax=Bacillus subtilis TaxID=1423 RepID=UPI00201CBA77|nr:hypothetical protein [Bacillus subtilis]UQZ56491.1 hypothetical protein C2H96_19360 [Bacillus subtilis]UQZ65132.1 hypothetical protein C2H97_00940 [Bacillus subtilis PY79]UQZ69558.1 hypothetical protein C2I05_02925 [Bacillus subtilis]
MNNTYEFLGVIATYASLALQVAEAIKNQKIKEKDTNSSKIDTAMSKKESLCQRNCRRYRAAKQYNRYNRKKKPTHKHFNG